MSNSLVIELPSDIVTFPVATTKDDVNVVIPDVASGNFLKVDNALVSVKLYGVPSGFVIVKVAK
jgi:hypothetical protein